MKHNKDAIHATLFGQPILHHTLLLWPNIGLKAIHLAMLLIEKGADMNGRNHKGETPLMIAANNGNELMVEFLVENGADISLNVVDNNGENLIDKVSAKLPKLIKKLITKNKNTIKQTQLERLLKDATSYFNINLIKFLMEQGANLNKIISEKNLIVSVLRSLKYSPIELSTVKDYFEFLLNYGVVCKLNKEEQQQFAKVLIGENPYVESNLPVPQPLG